MSALRQVVDVHRGITSSAGSPRPGWTAAALLVADAASIAVAALVGVAITRALGVGTMAEVLPHHLLVALLALVALAVAGVYPGAGLGPIAEQRRLGWALLATAATWLAATVLGALTLAWRPGAAELAPLWLLILAFITVPAGRALVRELHAHRRWWGIPVVVLGDEPSVTEVVDHLHRTPRLGLKPVACIISDSGERRSLASAASTSDVIDPLPTSGDRRHPSRLLILHGAGTPTTRADFGAPSDLAFVAPPDLRSLAITGVRPIRLDRAFDTQTAWTDLRQPAQGLVKRGFDVLLALPFAVAAAPLIAIAALAVMVVSPGAPFYYQVRAGLGGRPIRVCKIRTMYVDAAARLDRHLAEDPAAKLEWTTSFKLARDPRILPVVGRFLRTSSIDELPQVFNVLIGDMSFVGPRPFPEYHLAAFDDAFRQLRTTVRPGITGLWQVTARSDGDLGVQRDLDTAYIKNWSLGLDLYLLARTPVAVLSARGAR